MGMPENVAEKQKSHHSVKLPYLYKEGSKILQAFAEKKGSLKSLVYATRQEQLYRRLLALVSRAVEHAPVIDAALSSAGLLAAEPGLAASTARLLAAELLFGLGKLGSQARPVLTVLRYADRLRAAAEAGASVSASVDRPPPLPRYARVNTLLASVDDVIQQLTTEGWEQVEYPTEVTYEGFIAQVKSLSSSQFLLDLHVPCLLVFPPGTELHEHPLYRAGQLILQDKASCLPPLVLAPSPGEEVIDACSAPGMKTSQLAAMMQNSGTLVAVERDHGRFQTLSTMLKRAGVTNARLICGDFLRLRPEEFPRVSAILLDPSCSGTGMVSRAPQEPPPPDRLRRLANLQGMLLRHALSFPTVRRVVYSTCSVTEEENEQVVAATLAAHPRWRLAAAAPATWRSRGRSWLPDGERCIRADDDSDLCHGFFVSAFQREDGDPVEASGKKKKKKRGRSVAGRQVRESGGVAVEANGRKKKHGRSAVVEAGESSSVPAKRVRGEERSEAKGSEGEASSDKVAAAPLARKRKRSKAEKTLSGIGNGSACLANGGWRQDVQQNGGKKRKLTGSKKKSLSSDAVVGHRTHAAASAKASGADHHVKPSGKTIQQQADKTKVKNKTGKRLSKRRRNAMKKKPAVLK